MEVTSVKRIHQSDWTNHGVRFLRARDIVSAAKSEAPADFLYISEKKYNEFSNVCGKVQVGDLLVTGVGSIGIPLLIDHEEPLYFKDGNVIWFKNQNKIDGQFFYYSFVGRNIQKYIRDVAGIGTVGTYTIDSGKKTPISLPRREEQQKIGSFFKRLDDTIALHQSKVELTKNLKTSLLSYFFAVNTGTRNDSIPSMRFQYFDDNWKQRKLGDVVQIIMGQSPNSENYTENSQDHILVQGNADMKNSRVVPRVWTTQVTKLAEKGDLILSVRAPVGDIGKTDYDVVLGRGVAAIKGNDFIFQQLGKMKEDRYWSRFSTGSTFESINSNNIREAVIAIPGEEEQKKIGTFFKQLDNTITFHKNKIKTLQELKSSLLNSLFL